MSKIYDRRLFLKLVGAAGSVPLVGTSMASAFSQPTHASSIKGSAKSVVIPTHEWCGELDERLDFPGDWEIEVLNMKGYKMPVLTAQQMAKQLDKPIGTQPLREMVAGKKRVVITFDDLTRPTPTFTVMPWVMGELRAAGVRDENVLLLTAYGAHRAMTLAEVQSKLGKEPPTRFAWQNHNCFDNVKDIGTTSFKNRIKLNQTFLAADFKICISGVKGHEEAGLSGGAKAVMPGVAGIDTIEYNHYVILPTKLKTDPKNVDLLNKTALTYKATHQFKEAITYFQKALEVDPKNVPIRTDMASCMYYTGDVDGALAQLNKSLTYDPKHAGTLMNIGIIKWKGKNDVNGAISAWQTLLKLNPDFPQKEVIQHLITEARQQKVNAQVAGQPKG